MPKGGRDFCPQLRNHCFNRSRTGGCPGFEGCCNDVLSWRYSGWYKSCITLRAQNYGTYGLFLVMGIAGLISSTVEVSSVIRRGPPPLCCCCCRVCWTKWCRPSLRTLLWKSKRHLSSSHRPLSSSFWGLPYRILNINHKKELLRGLWVNSCNKALNPKPQTLGT